MGSFGGFYKGDKKKLSKKELEKKSKKSTGTGGYSFSLPEIIRKDKTKI